MHPPRILLLGLCAVAALYLAGLRHCVRTHGLHHYGVNRSRDALAPPPPAALRLVYDPALIALARYFRWRRPPGLLCDEPLDVRLLSALVDG